MDAMRVTYLEEANDLLSNLERALLALETNSNDKSYIEEVFRVMHTLKGNSSMFGLPLIAEFVHDLETIYDKIRVGEMALSKDLLDCTFLCLDHLKIIIHDSDLNNQINRDNHENLIHQITDFINQKKSDDTSKNSENIQPSLKTFHITFEPQPTIFENGTNPLFLLAEIASMGKSQAIPHFKSISKLTDYSVDSCFTYWDIYLETEKTDKDIMDVFVFVEDCSKIEITELPGINLLNNTTFTDLISKNQYQDLKTDKEEITSLATSLLTEVKPETAKQEVAVKTTEKTEIVAKGKKEKTISSIRVSSDKLDELMNLVSELVTTQAGLSLFVANNKIAELELITENVEKLSRRLRDTAFGMTLVPINNMFGRFQRMVRDVSGVLGKEIEFITEGGETELDKTIIETLTDPLMHILRNSLDHGVEKGEERIAKGKPASGKVILKAFYSGVFVYIQITDDGKGIDVEAVRAKAISKGIIKATDYLSEKEVFDLIFYPGFSTAQKVTDVSGRGVGMDVVKRNITDLKGSIIVDSKINEGTTLTIKLPLTLSIIDGLLVSIDSVNYIIPLSVITKCFSVNNKDMIGSFNNLIVLDEEQVPFIHLREEFGYNSLAAGQSQMIVVNNGERKVGISVDNIIGEYQAVVKPLGKYYKKQDFVSGASILGDGTIALVLDTNKVIDLYTQNTQKEEKSWQLN
ncbi:chemotaxis protein CheA [Aurantibacillus circumpalustris]|uniref:chemotaxis protein CheA n=1 Tax=Aurantibacillus circumpalustris TaxID=3036359 RepID=UPI00295C2515|nr:chemotaxis protein CheA [Aurantibacillus circumpalustris]